MDQITSSQFKSAVELDPAWASKLTSPVEITGYCNMAGSKITHLSPLLHFSGNDEDGDCASFYGCKYLKTAEGNFSGYTSFSGSCISKIGNLTCLGSKSGESACFSRCKNLKIAEGVYSGFVEFSEAGIQKIGGIKCGKNRYGASASFHACSALKVATSTYLGSVDFSYSGIEKMKDFSCEKNSEGIRLNVEECKNLRGIPNCFNPKEVKADERVMRALREGRFRESAKKHLQTEIIKI